MRGLLNRLEPVVDFGEPTSKAGRIQPAPRHAPTGDLTRSIRRDQSQCELDSIRRNLDLSAATHEAISVELLSNGGPLLGDEAVAGALHALFDFEPIGAMTAHPILLVGGSQNARMRAALAMSQRIERTGRRVALFSLRTGQIDDPQATYRGGLDILHVGSVEACIDAVRVKEPAELAIVEASCLDSDNDATTALPMLTLSLNAEAVYVEDGQSAMPDAEHLSGIERIILSGRQQPERFGAVLEAAYDYGWAFAGQCSEQGIWHPMTAATLADRFALAVR